jgi:hypothetical protein
VFVIANIWASGGAATIRLLVKDCVAGVDALSETLSVKMQPFVPELGVYVNDNTLPGLVNPGHATVLPDHAYVYGGVPPVAAAALTTNLWSSLIRVYEAFMDVILGEDNARVTFAGGDDDDKVVTALVAESLCCISYAYVPVKAFAGIMQLTARLLVAMPKGVMHCEVVAGA